MEEKKKSWFKKHWVVILIIGFFVLIGILTIATEGTDTNSELTSNVIKNQNSAGSEEIIECAGTFKQLCINKKIDECTELCAGEEINIPAVKTDCHSACYQVYYYGGEKDLDDLIEELGK